MNNNNEEDKSIEIIYNPSTFPLEPITFQNIIIALLILSSRKNCLFSSLPREILFLLFQIIFDVEYSFPNSTLLSNNHKKQLQEWLPRRKWVLLYKGVCDGLSNKIFHSKCDDQGETISIISSNDFLSPETKSVCVF